MTVVFACWYMSSTPSHHPMRLQTPIWRGHCSGWHHHSNTAENDNNSASSPHSSPSAQVSMTEAVIVQPDANTSSSSHSSPSAQVSMTEAVIAQPDANTSSSSHSSPSSQVSMTEAVIAQPDANTSSSSHYSPSSQVSMTEAVIAQFDANTSSSSHSSPSAQVSMTEAVIAQPEASTSSPESNSSSIYYSPQITDVTTDVLLQVVSHSLVDICGTVIDCCSYQDFHYYSCWKVFAVLGIGNYIQKKGYGKVLLTLNHIGGSQSLFITLKGYNRCIRQDALLCFLRNTQVLPRANKKKVVLCDLMSFVKKRSINKANLRDLIAATGLVISNWIQIVNFSARVTMKFDGWPWKTIGHFFYTTSSFVHHFKFIGEFKLDLQSRNTQFGLKLVICYPVWPWNLMDDLGRQ